MMVILQVVVVVLLLGHFLLIENCRRWFLQLRLFNVDPAYHPSTSFTIIVPARNEADNIEKCIKAIMAQRYPAKLFEVIIADDYSEDATAQKVLTLQQCYPNLRLLQLAQVLGSEPLNSYKKKAIELSVAQAIGTWIVTTDADCTMGNWWLLSLAQLVESKPAVFVAAPVRFINTGSFLSMFQCLDFMSLQGMTAASVAQHFLSMCNGANLAYNRQVFYEVGGFAGIDTLASGDDMMLMHKMVKRYPKQVQYLFSKAAIVSTDAMGDWTAFLNQRIRWASKADKYDDRNIIVMLAFVYVFNLSFLVVAVAACWQPVLWLWLLAMLVFKTLIDLRFMVPVARFFGETKLLPWFPAMQPVHILYTIIAGWLGKFGRYSWKGRTVR